MIIKNRDKNVFVHACIWKQGWIFRFLLIGILRNAFLHFVIFATREFLNLSGCEITYFFELCVLEFVKFSFRPTAVCVCFVKDGGQKRKRAADFPYWFGSKCAVCPLAPLLGELFHNGGRNRNYSAMANQIIWFANHHVLVLVLPAWSVGGVNDKITSDTYASTPSPWSSPWKVLSHFKGQWHL